MPVYDIHGTALSAVYDVFGNPLSQAYDLAGTELLSGTPLPTPDYADYSTDYQHAVLQARDAWTAQYRADDRTIPIVLHTDQHGRFVLSNTETVGIFKYLGYALKWDEVSAMIGLGDVDLAKANYPQMTKILGYACDKTKQINLWGNHDLWKNTDHLTDGEPFEVDFDTVYPDFNNETFGDESHAYNHKGIEYHIDMAHGVKYICLAGWEIDRTYGGYSHYVIGPESMEGIIDMLEQVDAYDIVFLSHCCPFNRIGNKYVLGDGGTNGIDTLYADGPSLTTSAINNPLVSTSETTLDDMLSDRMQRKSGTIRDSYGNEHAYDFTACTSDFLCSLMGHWHRDAYEYSTDGGILCLDFDAYAYGTRPFYFVNIDRTNRCIDGWKITNDAVVQHYRVCLHEEDDTIPHLAGITAAYAGGSVVNGTTLDDLIGIAVTGTYTDGSKQAIAGGWNLSGTLDVGDNTVTLTYNGLTSTFQVTVTDVE